jgi:ribosome modulation factor
MKRAKRERLERAGWKVGDAKDSCCWMQRKRQ